MQSELSRNLEEVLEDAWSFHIPGGDSVRKRGQRDANTCSFVCSLFICFKLASCSQCFQLHSVYTYREDNAGVEVRFEGLYVIVESSICLCCIIGRWRRACVVYCLRGVPSWVLS